jgi:DNA-binding MarR family transcriptional regulator
LNQSELNGKVRAMDTPNDLISTTEARKLIGISPATMARIIKEAVVTTYPNPLDKRQKLVSKSQVLALRPNLAEAA